MSPNNATYTNELQRLFAEAEQLPVSGRESFLRQECGDDARLRSDVMELLQFSDPQVDPLEAGCSVLVEEMNTAEHQTQLQPNPKVTGYSALALVAHGGQSMVYRAKQDSTGQSVALKVLSAPQRLRAPMATRLEREVQLLGQLQHPGIVPIVDSGQTDQDDLYIATRFIEGRTIDALAGQPNLTDVVRTCAAVARTVHFAHEHGVIHRDLKPSNVLIDADGNPYVLDFGLARIVSDQLATVSPTAETLDGVFVGSPRWASPEQVSPEFGPVDRTTDVYQLGVVFYHVLSHGAYPYPIGDKMHDAFHNILHTKPASLPTADDGAKTEVCSPPREQRNLVFVALDRVLQKALNKQPGDRYKTAAELADALESALETTPPALQPARAVNRRRPFIMIAALCCVVTAAILLPRGNEKSTDSTTKPQQQANDQHAETPQGGNPDQNSSRRKSILNLELANLSGPGLPADWKADRRITIQNGELTVARGTREKAVVSSPRLDAPGNWLLVVRHKTFAHGVLTVVVSDDRGHSVSMELQHKTIETTDGLKQKTQVAGQRNLTIAREGPRLVIRLQGAEAITVDARDFAALAQIEFGLQTRTGEGAGTVSVYSVSLAAD